MLKRAWQYASEDVAKSLGVALGVIMLGVLGASVRWLRSCASSPKPAARPAAAPVAGAFIKPDDQIYAGGSLAKLTIAETLNCQARIVRCPSIDCEDDANAISVILTNGRWQQSNPPTPHDWDSLVSQANAQPWQLMTKSRVVVHSAVFDDCAIALEHTLAEIGVDWEGWKDATMRGKGVQVLVSANKRISPMTAIKSSIAISPASTAVTSSPVCQSTPTSAVVMTNATPEELVHFTRNHTDVQAQRLIQPYIGKWMTVSCLVENVELEHGNPKVVFFTRKSQILIQMRFSAEQSNRVLGLNSR